SSWLAFPVGNIDDLTSTLSSGVERGGISHGFARFNVKVDVPSGGMMEYACVNEKIAWFVVLSEIATDMIKKDIMKMGYII
ncbi:hypothetical protein Tco_0076120, partial [Tanacetum coccineum]